MTSIKLTVLKHTKAKDGSYKIRLSIGHKQQTSYITTKYKINNLWQFSNGTIVRHPNAREINLKLRNMLTDYEERLEHITSPDIYTCRQLRDALRRMPEQRNNPTFKQVSNEYQKQLITDNRASYANMLKNSLRLFEQYNNGDILLTQITPYDISEFERHLKRKGLSQTYINMTLSMTRTIINRAIKLQYIKYDLHPFAYWKRTADNEREIDITPEEIKAKENRARYFNSK